MGFSSSSSTNSNTNFGFMPSTMISDEAAAAETYSNHTDVKPADDDDDDAICCLEFLSSFPNYLTYSLILVLISCGVYQMMISVLKMVVLSICGLVYLILVQTASDFLFDKQDVLLKLEFSKFDDGEIVPSKYFVLAIALAFIIALMIHGHQTESTYRLDFLWKLQATGNMIDLYIYIYIYPM